ncbi:hypothetical protein [Dyella sp. ASV21]|uniref:hypothetical protein n=1 Tax=Dyella sp. ASV21 TaxID=2795114 RepID=UPI0018EC8C20|nr:hypothetical protein [Dyella sp. ASV21]
MMVPDTETDAELIPLSEGLPTPVYPVIHQLYVIVPPPLAVAVAVVDMTLVRGVVVLPMLNLAVVPLAYADSAEYIKTQPPPERR